MELELAVDAESVTALPRIKPLAACHEGRTRNQPIKLVWYDSPDHALLAAGLTLTEQRGERRVQRIIPDAGTWLPAQQCPEIPEPEDMPGPLAPLAAFDGRRIVSEHRINGTLVTVTVDKGSLRAVTAERPAARICLSGEDHAVRAAATMIAAAIPAAVPLISLAADGIALALGETPAPRRRGAPALPDPGLSIPDALAHILGHLLDVMLSHASAACIDDESRHAAVHQMRVAVRRSRSAVSIFREALPRGALDEVNTALKALGARLGPARDWDVFVDETLPAIRKALPDDERIARLAAAAARRRHDHHKLLSDYLTSAAFRQLGIDLAWFVAARFWQPTVAVQPASGASLDLTVADAPNEPEAPPFYTEPMETLGSAEPPALPHFAAGVLRSRWRKLLSAGKHIEKLDIPSLHGVRLRAKRSRYAAEMFSALYPGKAANRFIEALTEVQQRLGVLNDGAVATHLLNELGGPGGRHAYAVGVITGFMAARAERIRPRIIKTFGKFRRHHAYWA